MKTTEPGPKQLWVVSACLAGHACRYNGSAAPFAWAVHRAEHPQCICICPEVLGGLSVPRSPCELRQDKIVTDRGQDCTLAFKTGVEKAMAQIEHALADLEQNCQKRALLKARSPSCGAGQIYDGTFSHTLITGNGVFAQALWNAGFSVFTEENFQELS